MQPLIGYRVETPMQGGGGQDQGTFQPPHSLPRVTEEKRLASRAGPGLLAFLATVECAICVGAAPTGLPGKRGFSVCQVVPGSAVRFVGVVGEGGHG